MISGSVSIDRSLVAGSPAPLVAVSNDPTATYVLVSVGRPARTARETLAPDSVDVDSSEVLAVAKERTSLPLTILVQADTTAALESAIEALEDATWQFTYPVNVTIDGHSRIWSCTPAMNFASIDGEIAAERAREFFEVLTMTLPTNPNPA